MKSSVSLISLPGRACAVSLLLVVSAFSQEATLESLVIAGRAAMEKKDWNQALELHTQATTRFGQDDPLRKFGAQFGAVFYHKGVCEMKLGKWTDAMRSFEICYREFPNTGKDAGNPFQLMALCKWGEAAMGAEEWELAASRFAKFVGERDRLRDKFPQGAFYVNTAICHYKLGRIPEGNEDLEIAIRNKADFPTPEGGIVAGFEALVGAAVAGRNEQALLDFIGRNRGALVIDPPDEPGYANVFLKLAGDAFAAGMRRAALAIYQFIPPASTPVAGADAPQGIRLTAIALIHEKAGNVRGAYAAWLQLEANHPGAKNREHHLYQLIRTASVIGEFQSARNHAWTASPGFSEIRVSRGSERHGDRSFGRRVEWTHAADETQVAPAKALPESRAFAAALDLYQGRKYQEAMAAFRQIKNRKSTAAGTEIATFAAFYEMECLRKSGDLKSLGNALADFKGGSNLDPDRLRQLEINRLWGAVDAKDWDRVKSMARPVGLRAASRRSTGTAGILPGSRPRTRRPSGRSADRPQHRDDRGRRGLGGNRPPGRAPRDGDPPRRSGSPDCDGTIGILPDENRNNPGLFRLQEAAAVAALFELSLGAGTPLPA